MMIVRVAGFARHAFGCKALVFMALGACERHVLAQQGKAGQRMIE